MMVRSLRTMLEGLIDYAGLFPPAGLPMADAVANYASYASGADSWALAQFVVPVARLPEFETAVTALPVTVRRGVRWPLSGLLGADAAGDLPAVEAFHACHTGDGIGVVALEGRASTVEEVRAVRAAVPARYELYLELPLDGNLAALVAAVAEHGARAKVRAGGTQAREIPAPAAVARFLALCAAARVSFKATAGLHHPRRGSFPLTYAPGSACATMFGYVNMLLAASAAWEGADEATITQLLALDVRTSWQADDLAVTWAGRHVATRALGRVRREFMMTVGSCSFTEPLHEIRES